jgi:hypothetical protein
LILSGFIWRMKSHSRRHLHKPKGRASPQAYPPPVVPSGGGLGSSAGGSSGGATNGAGPNGGSAVINFGDFDEKGWARFMDELVVKLNAKLRHGAWRQDSKDALSRQGVAMSCPRF